MLFDLQHCCLQLLYKLENTKRKAKKRPVFGISHCNPTVHSSTLKPLIELSKEKGALISLPISAKTGATTWNKHFL